MERQILRVIVIGAGYAGLLASVRLAMKTRKQNVQVSLINSSEMFVERPRLHQFAANQPVKPRPIHEVLIGTGVEFTRAAVTAINVGRKDVTVQVDGISQRLAYDYLLYTPGSAFDQDSVPGVRQFAYTLNPSGPHSAEELRSALPELNSRKGRLVVVGGGPTGIESAAEFAESYPGLSVTLVTQAEVGHLWGKKVQRHILKTLSHLGVSVQSHAPISRVEPDKLISGDGESIPFDLCLWAGGFVASPLAREAGLVVNERGQVLVDQYMRSISDPWVFAAGDSSQPVASLAMPVRMAAYTAAITGAHAADCLGDVILGREPQRLNFAFLGQAIALGRHEAVGFNNFPDDTPKSPMFTGQLGILGREFFVKLLADLPGIERRLPGLHFWPGRGKGKLAANLKIYPARRQPDLSE